MPIKQSQPKLDLSSKTILLYGPQKIGKSSFAAQFPGAVFIATERGLDNLTVTRWEGEDGHYVVRDWEEFKSALKEVCSMPETKTVVIDIVDHAFTFAYWHVCKSAGVEYHNDGNLGFGKGNIIIENEFRRVIKALTAKGIGVVFISHAKLLETENGVSRVVPTLPDKVRSALLGEVDMILYCTTRKETEGGNPVERRVIRTLPSALYEAGCRGPESGAAFLPDPLPLDYTQFAAAYQAAADAFAAKQAAKPQGT